MELCGAATLALPEPTACQPTQGQAIPSPTPHPTPTSFRDQVPELRRRVGSRGKIWGEGRASVGMGNTTAGLCLACLTGGGLLGRLQSAFFPPPALARGWETTFLNQPHILPHPSPLPPQITTRGREKGAIYRCRPCGCPNRAGWGGLGNSWGPGEEAGFPGGHGTAYLEPPSLPEHAHRPHTHHHGVTKATGEGKVGGSREPRRAERATTTSPAPPEDRQRIGGPQRHLREALKEGDKDYHQAWKLESP